ncbi:hypothetical protein VKT23_016306 [Stygiomarasmius scandens]|uniref:F-box domain-containing protein n=1 Tax=Marasmiellus scandens TaxID=2682957 RepID=A0ABR1IY42_9AGAR
MHHVLQVTELLNSIFLFLKRDDQVRCALICRSWSEVALDAIWSEVDDLRKLANLISPAKVQVNDGGDVSYIFDPVPGPKRWKRFESHYSHRVRVLNLKPLPKYHDLLPLLSAIQNIRTSLGILPNLHELNWDASGSRGRGGLEHMMMFMHENIKEYSLITERESDINAPSLMF